MGLKTDISPTYQIYDYANLFAVTCTYILDAWYTVMGDQPTVIKLRVWPDPRCISFLNKLYMYG